MPLARLEGLAQYGDAVGERDDEWVRVQGHPAGREPVRSWSCCVPEHAREPDSVVRLPALEGAAQARSAGCNPESIRGFRWQQGLEESRAAFLEVPNIQPPPDAPPLRVIIMGSTRRFRRLAPDRNGSGFMILPTA